MPADDRPGIRATPATQVQLRELLGREANQVATLTPRQEELLLHCFGQGYYEIPRRATLRALAHDLGISSASLSLVLRRAEAKVVEAFAAQRVK